MPPARPIKPSVQVVWLLVALALVIAVMFFLSASYSSY